MAIPKGFKHSKETKEKITKSLLKRQYWKGKIREEAPRWKGGRIKLDTGYIRLRLYNSKKESYSAYEHRFLMERHLNRKLERWEEVHHKNGIRDDNRIENLELVVKKKHFGNVRCPYCCKDFMIN